MPNQPLFERNRFYRAYRKIRFLARRGSLFSGSKKRKTANPTSQIVPVKLITLNSLLLFLIAYVIIYSLNLLITGFTALVFNIPVIVYYFDVDFLIRGVDWTSDSVSGVFSSGPISMLVLSIFLLILYKSVETETGILRLLVFWMILHALTRFFGEILAGALLNKGFGFVILYLFVMDTGKVVLTILGFVAMFTTGLFLARLSLYSANIYFNDLLASFRTRFLFYQFFLPFIFGNIIIFAIKIPRISNFDVIVNASMVLILTAILVRSFRMEDFYFDQERRSPKLKLILPLVAVVLLGLFRLVFGIGVRL